jgi:hypothetical protein
MFLPQGQYQTAVILLYASYITGIIGVYHHAQVFLCNFNMCGMTHILEAESLR